jgi:hypothetical protein
MTFSKATVQTIKFIEAQGSNFGKDMFIDRIGFVAAPNDCLGVQAYTEIRPDNSTENNTQSTKDAWTGDTYGSFDDQYFSQVTGSCQGTTEQILEWAAIKWNLDDIDPKYIDLLKAMAIKESWWDMDVVGDAGCSYGILQIRAASDEISGCGGWESSYPQSEQSTGFNADYVGAIVRFHYDGGSDFWPINVAGNMRKSVQAYYCGCTNDGDEPYVNEVFDYLNNRYWEDSYFINNP